MTRKYSTAELAEWLDFKDFTERGIAKIDFFPDCREPRHLVIDDFLDDARALIGTVLDSQGNQHLHGDDWQRTIYIDTLGVGTTDFDLSAKKKDALVESGRNSTNAYFRWFNSKTEEPVNRC